MNITAIALSVSIGFTVGYFAASFAAEDNLRAVGTLCTQQMQHLTDVGVANLKNLGSECRKSIDDITDLYKKTRSQRAPRAGGITDGSLTDASIIPVWGVTQTTNGENSPNVISTGDVVITQGKAAKQ